MKPKHIENITLAIDWPRYNPRFRVWLGLKEPEKAKDKQRKRTKMGSDHWVPAGGGEVPSDRGNHRRAAQREFREESGWKIPIHDFKKIALLDGYLSDSASTPWSEAVFQRRVHVYIAVIPEYLHDSYKCGKGFVKVGWFTRKKMMKLPMLEGDLEWIQMLLRGHDLHIKKLFHAQTRKLLVMDIKPACFS